MWVRVSRCDDQKQLVFGTLDSEPLNDCDAPESGRLRKLRPYFSNSSYVPSGGYNPVRCRANTRTNNESALVPTGQRKQTRGDSG